jgi:hypothetical protein
MLLEGNCATKPREMGSDPSGKSSAASRASSYTGHADGGHNATSWPANLDPKLKA